LAVPAVAAPACAFLPFAALPFAAFDLAAAFFAGFRPAAFFFAVTASVFAFIMGSRQPISRKKAKGDAVSASFSSFLILYF